MLWRENATPQKGYVGQAAIPPGHRSGCITSTRTITKRLARAPSNRYAGAIRSRRNTPSLHHPNLSRTRTTTACPPWPSLYDARRSRSASQARRAPHRASGEGGRTRTSLMRLTSTLTPLRQCNSDLAQYSQTPSLHHSNTPTLHHSITPSLHHSITSPPHPNLSRTRTTTRTRTSLMRWTGGRLALCSW
jgi:hypothetical protein